jgi:hypothetical protein
MPGNKISAEFVFMKRGHDYTPSYLARQSMKIACNVVVSIDASSVLGLLVSIDHLHISNCNFEYQGNLSPKSMYVRTVYSAHTALETLYQMMMVYQNDDPLPK